MISVCQWRSRAWAAATTARLSSLRIESQTTPAGPPIATRSASTPASIISSLGLRPGSSEPSTGQANRPSQDSRVSIDGIGQIPFACQSETRAQMVTMRARMLMVMPINAAQGQ